MKVNAKKMKTVVLSGAMTLLAAVSLSLGITLANPVQADAATLLSTEYKTDGASVRVLTKNEEGNYEEAVKQGIRFHVEMGDGYQAPNTGMALFDMTKFNENGSYQIAEGYKTYTLVLPTRLRGNSELTVNTAQVKKIDTTNYWFTDRDGNLESAAYIHSFPVEYFTDPLTYRGIICKVENGTETVVASTEMSERSLTWVAKQAYLDTIKEDSNYWGTEELDAQAAPIIKSFVPTYNITYDVNGVKTTEEVLWGETPKNVPSVEVSDGAHIEYTSAWFDAAQSEQVDINQALTFNQSCDITLSHTTSTGFNLTGVVDYNNFTANNTAYSGVKVYATLPVGDFYTTDEIQNGSNKMVELAKDAVTVDYVGSGSFSGLQGAWTLLEGKGSGAQMRLVFAFDSTKMNNGDKLIIRDHSVFYAHGVMYTLADEYTIEYKCDSQGKEDYGVFLGYLYNSDVAKIENWVEPSDHSRKRIRVTFYEDLLINSDFTFVFNGELPAGYAYPVYTKCHDTGEATQISEGYYYWNEGEHTILELNGYAYHNGDELFGAPGTMIVQNGGYFIFKDAMYAYYNGTDWVVGEEKGSFGANAFEWQGKDATDTTEIRFTTNGNTALTAGGTTDRWFNDVVPMTAEKMDANAPYAVWFTDVDGTRSPINGFMFHGQATQSGYNHIFAFKDFKGTQAGQMVTIANGTRFWVGSEYFTATEEMSFYYNGKNWVANQTTAADELIATDNYSGKGYNYYEAGLNKLRLHLNSGIFNDATGELYVESGSIKVNNTTYTNLKYHGSTHKILEIIGDSQNVIGKNAFVDQLVIEAGTRLWLDGHCVEFTDEWSMTYVGEVIRDGGNNPLKYEWIINNNTDISNAEVLRLYDATDAGGEVRLVLTPGILTDNFYGFMAVDASKGIPVVNGVEFANQSFAYGMSNNLIAVRGGEYGQEAGDYIVIPKGSVWWTSQGSLTFTEEIRGLYTPGWINGFNSENDLGDLTADDIQAVINDGANEVRLQIPRTISNTYYGAVAVDGTIMVTKANGATVVSTLAYWYSGTGYPNAYHTLIGFRATGMSGSATGDLLTIKAGTKLIFHTSTGLEGYHTFAEDIVYIYSNGTWVNSEGWNVQFTLNNATASINGDTIANGETIKLSHGTHNVTITPNSGYSITGVTSATNNFDGTYTLNITANMNVVVSTMQSIKLDASSILSINPYDETSANPVCMGVRFKMDGNTAFNKITGIHYGMDINGSVTATVDGGVYYASVFNAPHNFFELRFSTTNLKVGDEFKIAKGTVFSGGNNGGVAYAIEFTEDIVGHWTGSSWMLNPVKLGDLTWDDATVNRIINYSDVQNGNSLNYMIRIYLNVELFNTESGGLLTEGNVTIGDTAYTGGWYHHGASHKIIQISDWNYTNGNGKKLVISAGTRIYMGSQYYETTNTLTATCQGNTNDTRWNWTIS